MRNDPGSDDNFAKDPAPAAKAPIDPIAMARRDLKKSLPRRFWTDVTIVPNGAGYGIELDGKGVRTPGKAPLVVAAHALADLLAAEWRAQTEWVEPETMPLTRLVNTAIDGVARAMDATISETAKFAETDLVCYRAGDPEALVVAQAAAWDPILDFARQDLGARFICAEGVIYAAQPASALEAVREAVAAVAAGPEGALRLSALSLMTNLTGSVLMALAVARGGMTVDAAWVAAHVDEDFQMRIWGIDSEALSRRMLRWRDMKAAADGAALAV